MEIETSNLVGKLGPELIQVYRRPQVTISHPPSGRLHYFPPGLQLPSQPQSLLATSWPVPSYTAWCRGTDVAGSCLATLLCRIEWSSTI